MLTNSSDVESCDLRLGTVTNISGDMVKDKWNDVAFFRFGYFSYLKMNLENMVKPFQSDTWYTIDLLMEWNNRTVTIYVTETVNGTDYKVSSSVFFTDKKKYKPDSANALFLYNLAPSTTCSIKDL